MNALWIVIIALVTFIGGVFTEYGIQKGLPPKTVIQNINQVQTVDNRNTSIQSSEQAQITTTIVTPNTNVHMSVNYNGRTNFSHTFNSKTNRSSKTNTREDGKSILGIPIP